MVLNLVNLACGTDCSYLCISTFCHGFSLKNNKYDYYNIDYNLAIYKLTIITLYTKRMPRCNYTIFYAVFYMVVLTLANFASHFLCSLSKSGAVTARLIFATGFSWELSSFLFNSVFLTTKKNVSSYTVSPRFFQKKFYNKDLLTECEVCTGKYCLRLSEALPSSTDRANEVNKEFIIWLC